MYKIKRKWLLIIALLIIISIGIYLWIITDTANNKYEFTPLETKVTDVYGVLPGDFTSFVEFPEKTFWIGTTNGVVRYDESTDEWRIFTTTDGLACDCVNAIYEVKGRIWFLAEEAEGISYFDTSKKKFYTIPVPNKAPDKKLPEYVMTQKILEEEKSGALWFYSNGSENLYRWVPGDKTITPQSSNYRGEVNEIVQDECGVIWIFGNRGLARYDPENNTWNRINLRGEKIDEDIWDFDDKSIYKIYKDLRGVIWFYGTKGIISYNCKENAWKNYTEFADGKGVYNIFDDTIRGWIWFSGPAGVLRYNYDNDKIRKWDIFSECEVKERNFDIKKDWNGILWLVTPCGIFKSNEGFSGWLEVSSKDIKDLDLNKFESIIIGKNKDIWFYRRDGYLCHKPETRKEEEKKGWEFFPIVNGLPSTFPGLKNFKSKTKELEWAIFSEGVLVKKKNEEDRWEFPLIRGIRFNDVKFLSIDSKNILWAGLNYHLTYYAPSSLAGRDSPKGIYQFDQEKGFMKWIPVSVDIKNLKEIVNTKSGHIIFMDKGFKFSIFRPLFKPGISGVAVSIYEDKNGLLWIGRSDISTLDWEKFVDCEKVFERRKTNDLNKKIRKYQTKVIKPNKKFGPFLAIHQDAAGLFYFGSFNTVIRYDPNNKNTETILLPANLFPAEKDKDGNEVPIPILALHKDRFGDLWIGTDRAILRYTKEGKWEKEKNIENRYSLNLNTTVKIREGNNGMIWFLVDKTLFKNLYCYNSKKNSWKTIYANITMESVTLPDANGAIWRSRSFEGISRQMWNSDGVPLRPEIIPPIHKKSRLGRISYLSNNESFVLWRTRFTGLLKSTQDKATPYAVDNGFPVNVLEKAPDGGVWVGYVIGGLDLRLKDGKFKRFKTKDGLPNMTILDISQVPGDDKKPLAWIGTNDGAALVDNVKVRCTVKGESDPGPVDVVLAMPDGCAYFAFNTVSTDLFLDPPDSLPRQDTYIKHVSAKGEMGKTKLEVPRGQVMDMTLHRDKKTVWVGTTRGLYRLYKGAFKKITAKGRLQNSYVRRVVVDPKGTVWMGVDVENKRLARVVGYSPGKDTIIPYTFSDSLPQTSKINMLDLLPDGRLAVLDGGKLVTGQVFVPWGPLIYLSLALGIIIAGLSFVIVRDLHHIHQRNAEYKPLFENACEFFKTLGKHVKRLNYRTLVMYSNGAKIYIRIALGDLLPVEEVLETYKALPESPRNHYQESYLIFPVALDPSATRQLDVYRLRHNTVIVPLPLPFIRTKMALGPDAVREAWDGLQRRYLVKQDLFDMRNALDEARFFFGRKALIDELFNAFIRHEHVALTGPRKIGKSSLLNLLCQRLYVYPIIMIDLQLYNRQDESWQDQLFKDIISSYDRWAHVRYGNKWKPPEFEVKSEMIGPSFRDALKIRRDLQKRFKNDQPLVIMLDEMERLFPKTGPDHSEPQQVERFIRFAAILRALGQASGDRLISLVIADRQPLFNQVNSFKISGVESNPFYRFFIEFYLKPLEENECDEMITEISHAMGLEVAEEVKNSIYTDSGGYPSLARQLASAASSKRHDSMKIESPHYHEGLGWLHEERDIARFFKESFWETMNYAERRILFLAAAETGVPLETLETLGPIPMQVGERMPVVETLLDRADLLDARRYLLAVGILEKYMDNYRVCGTLFRRWLRENICWPTAPTP